MSGLSVGAQTHACRARRYPQQGDQRAVAKRRAVFPRSAKRWSLGRWQGLSRPTPCAGRLCRV